MDKISVYNSFVDARILFIIIGNIMLFFLIIGPKFNLSMLFIASENDSNEKIFSSSTHGTDFRIETQFLKMKNQ